VVVGGRAAARQRERGEPGAAGGAFDVSVDLRPDGIELLQPLEQRRLLGEAARSPLVEVVVAVDQPRRGQAAAAVDAPALDGGRGAVAHGRDPAVLDHDVPVGVLGAGGVDRGDRAALDHERPAHDAARRTASRIFS
jgi:hypothetical protein